MTTAAVTGFLPARAETRSARPRHAFDPRVYQIATLAALLAYGVLVLDFDVRLGRAALVLLTALATQYAASRAAGLPRVDLRSALISALSLALLLRTGSLWLTAAAPLI